MKVLMAGRKCFKLAYIEAQVKWTLEHFGLKDDTLTLAITRKRGLIKRSNCNGITGRVDDHILVVVDESLDFPYLSSVVAHELVHVKQLAEGKLVYNMDGDREKAVWKGRKIKLENLEYIERPWELEAYGQQEILARRFDVFLRNLKDNKNGSDTRIVPKLPRRIQADKALARDGKRTRKH